MENEEVKKGYYAIIPASVRYDEHLCANAKLLYGEITALCNEKGFCWATNNYFASLYKVSKQSISKWIKNLKEQGYIEYTMNYKKGSKEILHRYIRIIGEGIQEKFNTPIKQKFKENNTVINNTINNKERVKPTASDDLNIFIGDSEPSGTKKVIDLFHKMYLEAHGTKPTTNGKVAKLSQELSKIHTVEVIEKKMKAYFKKKHWFSVDKENKEVNHTFSAFYQHFDEINATSDKEDTGAFYASVAMTPENRRDRR